MPPTPPAVDSALLALLRADLEAAPYTSEAAHEILGPVAAAALGREHALPARRILGPRTDPTSVLLDVFTLGGARPAADVAKALPRLGIDGAISLGLITAVDAADAAAPLAPSAPAAPPTPPSAHDVLLRSLVDLAPYSASDEHGEIRWWIASDLSELATGRPLAPEHVLGVGGASLTLLRVTPRTPVRRALDLGCGCGIQALHASRHARTVVATDISERALAFTAFNAALNGVELDLRVGSFFEPAPEGFDLILSNPPFVITPRGGAVQEWTYRDGGATGDGILREVLADLPRHLNPGGVAVMLGNWEVREGAAWDEHPRAWIEGSGLDALVIQRETEDPAQYAETWARDGGITDRDPAWAPMVTAWLEDFASRDVTAIGFGYLLLSRPSDPTRPVLVTEEVTTTGTGDLGAHLAGSLAISARLAALPDDELAALRPVRAPDVIERRHLTPGAWDPLLIDLVQGGGLGRTVRADQVLAATVGACDGSLTLAQIIAAVCALTDEDESAARERTLPAVRELLRVGMLDLLEAPS